MRPLLQNLSRPRVVSLLVAVFVLSCAAVQMMQGAAGTPTPARNLLAHFLGYDPELCAKLVVAFEVGLAAAVLIAGTRLLAATAAVAGAFLALACVSAGFRDGGAGRALAAPLVALVAALGLAWLSCAAPTSVEARKSRRGLSPAWSALLALFAATLAARWSASLWNLEVVAQSTKPQTKGAGSAIDFEMKSFVGRPLSESPVGAYMPELVARVGAANAVIVFYNPYCEACHTLFADNFATPRAELSIAVEIPLAAGATLATNDPPEPIVCAMCEKTSLPPGPAWMIAAPLTVRVEKGVITCVADRFGGDCFTYE